MKMKLKSLNNSITLYLKKFNLFYTIIYIFNFNLTKHSRKGLLWHSYLGCLPIVSLGFRPLSHSTSILLPSGQCPHLHCLLRHALFFELRWFSQYIWNFYWGRIVNWWFLRLIVISRWLQSLGCTLYLWTFSGRPLLRSDHTLGLCLQRLRYHLAFL